MKEIHVARCYIRYERPDVVVFRQLRRIHKLAESGRGYVLQCPIAGEATDFQTLQLYWELLCSSRYSRRRESRKYSVHPRLSVCLQIKTKRLKLQSPNSLQRQSIMSPGYPSKVKGQGHRVTKCENIFPAVLALPMRSGGRREFALSIKWQCDWCMCCACY